jgi:hypothetical protein
VQPMTVNVTLRFANIVNSGRTNNDPCRNVYQQMTVNIPANKPTYQDLSAAIGQSISAR